MEKKKRRSKPQDETRLTRNSQVKIRLSADEVAQLKAAAAEQHMSLADFVMAGVEETKRIVIPGGAQIRSELVRQGRNLNYAMMLCSKERKEGQPVDLNRLVDAAVKSSAAFDQLTELILKWNADISETVGEVTQDADSEMRSQ